MQDERLSLVEQFAAQELWEICWGFGVSRKTGYKWFEQYQFAGVPAFISQGSRPGLRKRARLPRR